MKNQTQPEQRVNFVSQVSLQNNIESTLTLEIARNEFTDYQDALGFFETEVAPFEFLSVEQFAIENQDQVTGGKRRQLAVEGIVAGKE